MKKQKQKKHYRGHGTGTLIQQASGLFLAKWCYGGRTYVRSTKTHDRDEAEKKLDEFVRPFLEKDEIAVAENLLAKVRTLEKRHESEEQKTAKQIPLKDLFDRYIETVGSENLSENTQANYRSYASQFILWMTEHYKNITTLGQVTSEETTAFMKHLEKTRTANTFNAYYVTLKLVFKTLLNNTSMWNFKLKPEKVVYERRALSSAELKLLLKHVARNRDLNVLFHLGIYTGMRLSDCATLRWKDIDLDHKVISIVPIKVKRYGRRIHIPIHPKLFTLLKGLSKGVQDREEYVSSLNAHRYKHSTLGYVLKGVFTACGINNGKNHLSFHTLRHTFVSVAANNNIPLPIVQSIVGHSTKSMTLRYYHTDTTYALNIMSKISF